MVSSSRVTITEYDGPQKTALTKHLPVYADLVDIQPVNTRMGGEYKNYHKQYQEFVSKPTDVWVGSYPKAGKS